jgi:small-conductance mechanosensitive channel
VVIPTVQHRPDGPGLHFAHHYCFGLLSVGHVGWLSVLTSLTWELVVGSAVLVALFALVGEGVSRIVRRLGRRAGLKETTLISIRDGARVIWIVLAIVAVAFYAKLASDLDVLAFSTVGGLVLSLALQATLSNVIAGLFMIEDGTLRLGDEITYSSIRGTVIRITLRTTWLMSEKGVIVVVSNSNLMSGPLTIHSGTTRLVSRYHLEGLVPHQPPPETSPEKKPEQPEGSDQSKSPDAPTRRSPEKRPKKGPAKESPPGEA